MRAAWDQGDAEARAELSKANVEFVSADGAAFAERCKALRARYLSTAKLRELHQAIENSGIS
jgi:TRAP-type C4-dicarboxylate transport system substrate-binding protein